MTSHRVLFISGIDTDAGKTYATAWLAQQIAAEGRSVITQKFIQTGCTDSSEDIEAHRRLCGMELQPVDLDHTTAPIIFSYPASAQLAARIDGREIDLGLVEAATGRLLGLYDCVLLEGAGGLMVPVTDDVSTIDYVAAHRLPVVLVTNGRLGSINHTVLSLEAIAHRGIELAAVVYNHHFDTDPVIAADTRAYIARYLSRHFPATPLLDLPTM
ncbi:MAG: dethiobiotin synthase [Muribaculaceae bacterium]|nr:dethiobiotin synthase [Muribaculaceae bacterium]